jgi:hypothetical protein
VDRRRPERLVRRESCAKPRRNLASDRYGRSLDDDIDIQDWALQDKVADGAANREGRYAAPGRDRIRYLKRGL